MFAPSFLAVYIHESISKKRLSRRQFAAFYCLFLLTINLIGYAAAIYLFKNSELQFTSQFFVKYTTLALILAVVLPVVIKILNINVKIKLVDVKNKKKS